MKKEVIFLLVIICLSLVTTIYAFDFEDKNYGLEAPEPKVITFNNNTAFVNNSANLEGINASGFWQSFNAQTGLTGNKEGSFNIDTSGNVNVSNLTARNGTFTGNGFFGDNVIISKDVNDGDVNLIIRNTEDGPSDDETISIIAQSTSDNFATGKIVFARENDYDIGAAAESSMKFYTTRLDRDMLALTIDKNQDAWWEGGVNIDGDNEKHCLGESQDVCSFFNVSDLIHNAEVGSPNVFWTGFNSYNFDNAGLFGETITISSSTSAPKLEFLDNSDGDTMEVRFNRASHTLAFVDKDSEVGMEFGTKGILTVGINEADGLNRISLKNDLGSAIFVQLKAEQSDQFSVIPSSNWNLHLFEDSASGETMEFRITGRKSGDSQRTFAMGISSIIDDAFNFSGVSKFYFNGNVIIDGNLNVSGNITSQNVFIPQYVFSHNDATIPVVDANVWTNITFDQEDDSIKQGITHTFNDNTNTTYNINEDGTYSINFNLDIEDLSVGASDIDVAGRIVYINGSEIVGSVFENDIIKQAVEYELVHTFLASLKSGDKIIFQFIADDADVVISTHASFGDHPDSATIIINKIANLP